MKPLETQILLIPLFNIVWQFIVVNRIADSLAAEFKMRNINVNQSRPTYDLGIAYCICSVCGIIPLLGVFVVIVAFILWIIYQVKVNAFKIQLSAAYDPSQGQMPTEVDWFNDSQKLEY